MLVSAWRVYSHALVFKPQPGFTRKRATGALAAL